MLGMRRWSALGAEALRASEQQLSLASTQGLLPTWMCRCFAQLPSNGKPDSLPKLKPPPSRPQIPTRARYAPMHRSNRMH